MTCLVILITLVIAVFFVWGHYIEPSMIRVRHYDINLGSASALRYGIRIAQFSDVHLGFSRSAAELEDIAAKVNAEKPDIIVFTGDMYDDYADSGEDDGSVIAALNAFSAPMGKYAVIGNHDNVTSARRRTIEILTEGGFTVLIDRSVELEEFGISLFGLDDCIYGGDPSAFKAKEGYCNILLCHEPDIFDKVSGEDLMLSGHTHGGQAVMPVVGPLHLPKLGKNYPGGLYEKEGSYLCVSRGLGATIVDLRFLCPPEISIIDLN